MFKALCWCSLFSPASSSSPSPQRSYDARKQEWESTQIYPLLYKREKHFTSFFVFVDSLPLSILYENWPQHWRGKFDGWLHVWMVEWIGNGNEWMDYLKKTPKKCSIQERKQEIETSHFPKDYEDVTWKQNWISLFFLKGSFDSKKGFSSSGTIQKSFHFLTSFMVENLQ